jgi:hypothetical protein
VRVLRDVVSIAELVEAGEAGPIGFQRLRDVRADEALEEKHLFFEGGAGLLQCAVREEAVRRRPHEDAAAGGDVRTVDACSETIFCLGFSSPLLRKASVNGDADVRDDLQFVG